jgi:hypothetical protein
MKLFSILLCIIGPAGFSLAYTTFTVTWDLRPAYEHVRFYNLYEQVNGTWVWRGSPAAPPFKFTANKGTRTYAMTSVNDSGESQAKSNTVTIRVKH